jgi:hypothetical protein
VGSSQPTMGRQVFNEQLATLLQTKRELTAVELAAVGASVSLSCRLCLSSQCGIVELVWSRAVSGSGFGVYRLGS